MRVGKDRDRPGTGGSAGPVATLPILLVRAYRRFLSPLFGPAVPLPAELQRVRPGGAPGARGAARHVADGPPDRPVPPLPRRRVRPGSARPRRGRTLQTSRRRRAGSVTPGRAQGGQPVSLSLLDPLYRGRRVGDHADPRRAEPGLPRGQWHGRGAVDLPADRPHADLIFPLFVKQIHASRKMQELNPQVQALRKKYKNDKQRLNQEMMKLYQEAAPTRCPGAFRWWCSSRSSSRCSDVLRAISTPSRASRSTASPPT